MLRINEAYTVGDEHFLMLILTLLRKSTGLGNNTFIAVFHEK